MVVALAAAITRQRVQVEVEAIAVAQRKSHYVQSVSSHKHVAAAASASPSSARPGYPGFQQRNLSLELNCLGCAYEFRVQHTHTHMYLLATFTHIHVAAALLESHLQKSYQHRSLSLSLVSLLQSSSLSLWSCCLVPSSPCCRGAIFDTALACHKLPNASNMALKCTRRAKLEKLRWLI